MGYERPVPDYRAGNVVTSAAALTLTLTLT
jgi:hypothetical protein